MLSRARFSLQCFIVFSVIQSIVFIVWPWVFDSVAPGLDAAPQYQAMRLIGVRELGLMTVYWAAVGACDGLFMSFTVAVRLTVIPFTAYLILVQGAPLHFAAGVIQDVIGSLWTLWGLSRDNWPPRLLASSASEPLIRLTLLVAGLLEIAAGYTALVSPQDSGFIKPEFLVKGDLGCRSVGFMTTLLGAYQVLSCICRMPVAVYAAWAFHHVLGALSADVAAQVVTLDITPPPVFGISELKAVHACAAVALSWAIVTHLISGPKLKSF
eukprot:Hpha_TRINITY_DN15989_c0_g3::TRINITY_DN15989_c0_g3_i1::g.72428::m.72428